MEPHVRLSDQLATDENRPLPVVMMTDTARTAITHHAVESADGRETGGIMLGHSFRRPRPTVDVVQGIGPGPDAVRRETIFRRDVGYAQAAADLAYYTDESLWIGEWHTHPNGPASPSTTDLTSYRRLLADAELGFDVFLSIIVTPDPATGFRHPRLSGWLITSADVHAIPLHSRLLEKDTVP